VLRNSARPCAAGTIVFSADSSSLGGCSHTGGVGSDLPFNAEGATVEASGPLVVGATATLARVECCVVAGVADRRNEAGCTCCPQRDDRQV